MSLSLQLDIGNSGAKWRLMDDDQLSKRGVMVLGEVDTSHDMLQCSLQVDEILVASVASDESEQQLSDLLHRRWNVEPWFARTVARLGDLENAYQDPSRMGVDRWLAMLGARHRTKARVCVIDAGSALTIDLVAANGQHEGGYIIPGPALMERVLLQDTDRVRFSSAASFVTTPGKSTAEAVSHGSALAQVGAVGAALDQCGGEPPALFFCGGGGETLRTLLARGGAFVPDLVFEGLQFAAAYR